MGGVVRDDPVSREDRPATETRAMSTREFLRWCWTQLTSMRTALALLFLVALGSVPGSMFPQYNISPVEVQLYKNDNPELAAVLEPLGMFSVYTSPWFSALYLLLFISLIGCILPRIGVYARNVAKPPPRLPARPERLAEHRSGTVDDAPAAIARADSWLRAKRYRTLVTADGVSAERGYSREAGNLVFHSGLVVLLVGLAWSSLLGFHGSAVVVEGNSFSNSITQYDEFSAGGLVDTDHLTPFTVDVNSFVAEFETGDVQRGAARRFDTQMTVHHDGETWDQLIQVNHPLTLPTGEQVNVMGHGYAAHITVTDGNGDVAFAGPVVFLPQDGNFSSIGVVKVPDARPQRLAFEAFFFPTAVLDETGPHSVFPDALNPEVFMNAWSGDPAVEDGVPESIYVLDTAGLAPIEGDNGEVLRMRLVPGSGMELPDGLGSITFEGWSRWVKLQVSITPGNALTLVSLAVAVAGLCVSLFVRPRRLFVRITGDRAAVAGLDRTDAASGLDDEVTGLAEAVLGGPITQPTTEQAEWGGGLSAASLQEEELK
ncbi:cytochrome c biogenesis protein ResB [Tessaracoccus rhinocerotis]|uniref:cytochrome c biogenesis protein ResB n=1 Tax=Tessaracoccus rhinocerotis TaxID=1689449 RepID=UPI003CCC7FBD